MTTVSEVPVLAMGAGIAQIAAQASHRVFLFDLRTDAANDTKAKLAQTFDALVGNGRLESNAARDALARIVLRAARLAFEHFLALEILGFAGANGREGFAALSEKRSPRFPP